MTELLTKLEAVIAHCHNEGGTPAQTAQAVATVINQDLIGLNVLDRPAPFKYMSPAERQAMADRSTRVQAQNTLRNNQRKMLGL